MKKIIIFLGIGLLFASCNGTLVEEPEAIAVETYYNNSGEVESGIAAIYSPLRTSGVYQAQYQSMLETSSDFLHGRASWAPPSEFQGLNNTNISRVGSAWQQLYLSIRNANIIIKNVPNAKSLSENAKSQYIGEAKFLRAFDYFQLVRNWGAIPLRDEQNMSEINVPRSAVGDVYSLMISDLNAAESSLGETVSVAGHPSKWAAKTVLADVYFYKGEYDKAAAKAKEVIQSNAYSLVEISSANDFEKLYGADVTSSSEEIFYMKFNLNYPLSYALYLHGVGKAYINQDGYYALYSNKNFTQIKNWDDKDLRKAYNWYEYSGFDAGTVLCKKFSDKTGTQPRNDFPVYRYADLLLIYAEATCRAAGQPTAEGVEALNMVHRRAYGYPSTQASPVDFNIGSYNKDSFIDLCMQERGYETVGEGKRWLDLKRSGKAAEIIKANMGKTISESHYLWPIPVSELNYNSAITDQNLGY